MAYSSNVARLQDTLENLTQEKSDNIQDLEKKFEDQQNEYSEREARDKAEGSEYQDIGIGSLQGIIGVKGIKSAVGKAKSTVEKAKKTVTDLQDRSEELLNKARATGSDFLGEARGQVEELAQQAQGRVRNLLGKTPSMKDVMPTEKEASTLFDTEEDGQNYNAGEDIPALESKGRVLQSVENPVFEGNTPESALGGSLEEAGEGLAKKSASSIGSTILDSLPEASEVLDAIPVIGEGTAIVGGLVTLVEGLYHIFKHDKAPKPPAPPGVQTLQAPNLLTQKFSDAVPSMDTATDRSGAIMNF